MTLKELNNNINIIVYLMRFQMPRIDTFNPNKG